MSREDLGASTLGARLATLNEALEARNSARPELVARLLEERARELARPLAPPVAGAAEDVLVFRFGGADYALDARAVVEVTRIRHVSVLPGAPPQIVGVTNLRGQLLPLVDLGVVLGSEAPGGASRRLAVVVGTTQLEFGILVDGVDEVRSLLLSELAAPVGEAPLPRTRGVTRTGLVVLDAIGLLTDSLLVIEEAGQVTPASDSAPRK